jgi:hypothetical protein
MAAGPRSTRPFVAWPVGKRICDGYLGRAARSYNEESASRSWCHYFASARVALVVRWRVCVNRLAVSRAACPASAEVAVVNCYYEPGTGQFLSVDPLVDQTGLPYGYTGGDPVNGVDPLGLLCLRLHCLAGDVSAVFGGIAGVAGVVALVTSWIPGVDVVTAGIAGGAAGVAAAADVISCLSGPCDATALTLDLASVLPGLGAIKAGHDAADIAKEVVRLKSEGNGAEVIAVLERKVQNKKLLQALLGAKSSSLGAAGGAYDLTHNVLGPEVGSLPLPWCP